MKFDSPGVRVQLSAVERWTSLFGKLLLLGGLSIFTWDTSNFTAFAAMAFGPLLILASYAFMLVQWRKPGSLDITGGTALVERGGSRSLLGPKNIASAYVSHRVEAGRLIPVVEVRTRVGNVFQIDMHGLEEAHTAVEALGFGARGRATTIDLEHRSRRPLNILLGMMAFSLGSASAFVTAVFFALVLKHSSRGTHEGEGILVAAYVMTALAYAFLKRWFAPATVAIGSDGIAVKQRLSTERIARNEIVETKLVHAGGPLAITRRAKAPVMIGRGATDPARLAAAARVCEERFRVHEEPPRAAAFERGERDVDTWKTGIRTALDAGYRDAGASLEDARTVLASPAATTEQRLGAALALRVAGEPPERIRVAAETVVDPHAQEAFEAIAEDEDERLERTMKKMSR